MFRDLTDRLNQIKGYATKDTATRKMVEVLGTTNASAFVTRNDNDRWVIVLLHNYNDHHVSMYATHKNNNVIALGG